MSAPTAQRIAMAPFERASISGQSAMADGNSGHAVMPLDVDHQFDVLKIRNPQSDAAAARARDALHHQIRMMGRQV